MNLEETLQQNEEIKRVLIQPRTVITPPDFNVAPRSNRQYDPLEPVNVAVIKTAANMTDGEDTVMAPIGGLIELCRIDEADEGTLPHLDDLMAVPVLDGTLVKYNQIPIMVDEQPPTEHDHHKEYDFGRLPTYQDYCDSVDGQEKPVEQVLAFPAWPFLAEMIGDGGAAPSRIQDAIYTNLAFLRRAWCETDTRYLQLLPYITFWKKVGDKIKIFVYQRGKGVGEARLAGGCSIGVGGHVNPIDFLSMQSKLGHDWSLDNTDPNNYKIQFTGRMLVEGFWGGILNNVIREGDEEVKFSDLDPDSTSKPGEITLSKLIAQSCAVQGVLPEQWLWQRTSFFLDYAANPVEKVHLGMFIAIEVPENIDIATSEEELHDVGFVELEALYDQQRPDAPPWEGGLPSEMECWSQSIIASLFETSQFIVQNPSVMRLNSKFMNEAELRDGMHLVHPEVVASIPSADRWKIGTLASSFGDIYRFYAMNAFVRI